MSFGIPVRNGLAIGLLSSTFLSTRRALPPPALSLNFLAGAPLDSRITFTRSTTATFVGSNGLIQSSAINAPRFEYNPATLAALGLLIEGQRTNSLTYSAEFDNAAWTKVRSSVTANATTSPDGTANADKLVEDTTASNTHLMNVGSISFTSGTSYSYSVYVKAAERSQITLLFGGTAFGSGTGSQTLFDLTTVTATNLSGVSATTSITAVGNGWFRCTATLAATATAADLVQIRLASAGSVSYTGNGTSGLFLWGAQLEDGAFTTSYIPTVAAAVTRAADIAFITGADFTSWYNQSEGTFVVSASLISNSGSRVWIDVGPNAGFGTTAYITQTSTAISIAPGSPPVNLFSQVSTTTLTNKTAMALINNNSVIAVSGTLGTADTSCTVPASATRLAIGSPIWDLGGGSTINGRISQITYYNVRLADVQLQAATV